MIWLETNLLVTHQWLVSCAHSHSSWASSSPPRGLVSFCVFSSKIHYRIYLSSPPLSLSFCISHPLIFLPELSLDMQICVSSSIVNTWHDIHILLFALSHLEIILPGIIYTYVLILPNAMQYGEYSIILLYFMVGEYGREEKDYIFSTDTFCFQTFLIHSW